MRVRQSEYIFTNLQKRIAILPRSHPARLLPIYHMAMLYDSRYVLLHHREDLDRAILHFTELILFPPHCWAVHDLVIFDILFFFANALLKRSGALKQPDDAIYAAIYLRHLRNQPHQVSCTPRHKVTARLADALILQVAWEGGNFVQNITEMSVLCHELLTSDESGSDETTLYIEFLSTAVVKFSMWDPDLPLDQVIECLQLGRIYKPELWVIHTALVFCLTLRYHITLVADDYEAATSILDEVTSSSSPRDNVHHVMGLVALMASFRSHAYTSPEYTEEAIYRERAYMAAHPSDRPSTGLGHLQRQRFDFFGASSSGPLLREPLAIDWKPKSEVDLPVKSGVDWFMQKMELLKGLLHEISKIPEDDIAKIDETLEKGRAILASFPRHTYSSYLFETFACILFEAHRRTHKIEYLDETITTLRQVFERPLLRSQRFAACRYLALALLKRWEHYFPSYRTQDMDEGLELFSQCVNDGYVSLSDRYKAALAWSLYARVGEHPTLSTAYESAISLTQETLLFAPTLQLQHVYLSEVVQITNRVPQDYASYQIIQGQVEQAIETLEKGRALLWAEMRHLRTSIDHLLQVDPQLGQKFGAINRDLEELIKSIPPSHTLGIDDGPADDLRDPFGRLLLRHRRLLKERGNIILQIQALPGFRSFMVSPSFDILRVAASSGPVIIINHSLSCIDILILLHDAPPSLISTITTEFPDRSMELNDEILVARNKHGPDSYQYNKTLAHVLAELYDLVGKPVIDRLRELNVPEQSRVWWYPTSVFCSLPLHAMGPIPSDDGEDRYFMDLYIPSYTPTLSTLIPASDSHNPGSHTSSFPSVLLVAHFDVPSPDMSLSEVCEDVKVVEQLNRRLPVTSLISEGATPTSVLDRLQDHQFVHFVCHGTLETKKPFDAGFELHANERLTLLDIVRSRLPAAEFAFLSACHTAELTEGSSFEEVLHLAAAVQYSGFKSVVGTMWAMANQDGPELAKHFYKSMFPKKEKGKEKGEPVPYYKRSAGALRDAVKKLRKKRGMTVERWVNYVHYGA